MQRFDMSTSMRWYKSDVYEYVRHAAPSQGATALLIAARVQELSEAQPAHVVGPGRNGGELHEGSEHLRRVAADGRLRLPPSMAPA